MTPSSSLQPKPKSPLELYEELYEEWRKTYIYTTHVKPLIDPNVTGGLLAGSENSIPSPIENWFEQYMPILYEGQTALEADTVIKHYRHPSREAEFLRMKNGLIAICAQDKLTNAPTSHAEYTRKVIGGYLRTPEGIKDSTRHTPNNWTRHGWF